MPDERRSLDPDTVSEWLPVVVQIGGVVLMFVLVAGAITGHLQDAAVLAPAALAMMLGKYVRDAARPVEPPE